MEEYTVKSAARRTEDAEATEVRCLIENSSRAVGSTHVVNQVALANEALIKSVEWSWGMKKVALKLVMDSKENTFFVSATFREMYGAKKWALLPERSVVRQYMDEDRKPLERENFPNIEGPTFKYTALPMEDLRDALITRYMGDSTDETGDRVLVFQTCTFDDLPAFTSTVHPKFAILHIGYLLARSDSTYLRDLKDKHPVLHDIEALYSKWIDEVPKRAASDPTYTPVPESMEQVDLEDLLDFDSDEGSADENDSIGSLSQRLLDLASGSYTKPSATPPKLRRSPSPYSSDGEDSDYEVADTPSHRIRPEEITPPRNTAFEDDDSDTGTTPPRRVRMARL
ncbi:hypothetical protein BJ165DRAFT_1614513 [Panaeolus papilionaceus]|nr:hypothetical protein BJ165DRAFT_1614513 [Panaeolus papilionaceus]